MKLDVGAKKEREPDLTGLINIVFLILIFFIVAGAIRPFSAQDLELAKTPEQTTEATAPGRLIVHRDGRMQLGRSELGLEELPALLKAETSIDRSANFVVVADGRLPAERLLQIVAVLRAGGFQVISVMTERATRQ
jgi:biopolymer transport protein ExbD